MRYAHVDDSCAAFATYHTSVLAVDPCLLNTVAVQLQVLRRGYRWLGQPLRPSALVHRRSGMSHLLLKPVSRVAEYLELTWMYLRAVATHYTNICTAALSTKVEYLFQNNSGNIRVAFFIREIRLKVPLYGVNLCKKMEF